MGTSIRVISFVIILFGLTHLYFVTCRSMDIDTLWFIGTGFAIIFPGILNLVAIDRGGSRFTEFVALCVNAVMLIMFLLAIPLMDALQVYLGIGIFLVSSFAFGARVVRRYKG